MASRHLPRFEIKLCAELGRYYVHSPLSRFQEVASSPYRWVAKWKAANGRKVVGCLPMYVPEEILHAAGILPVVLQGRDGAIGPAYDYVHAYLCHSVRSNLDAALRRELDFADGLVIPDICDQAKRVGSLWRRNSDLPFFHFVSFPKAVDAPGSSDFLIAELASYKKAVERFAGAEISDESLGESIRLYNQTRHLLGELQRLRTERPEVTRSQDVAVVIAAAMSMPKEEFNSLLLRYLQAKQVEISHSDAPVRLVLAGQPCEDVETGFLAVLEELGAAIVDDDLHCGSKYLNGIVSEEGDRLAALAGAYLQGMSCPTKYHVASSWPDVVVSKARDSRASGVVVLLPKFCEIFAFDYPALSVRLMTEGIPHLALENDHSGVSGAVKTRLQAFLETLKGDC